MISKELDTTLKLTDTWAALHPRFIGVAAEAAITLAAEVRRLQAQVHATDDAITAVDIPVPATEEKIDS